MSVCINQKFINIHKTQTVPGVKVLDDVLREAAKKVILFSGPATRGGGLNLVAIGAFLVKNKFQKKCIPPPLLVAGTLKRNPFFAASLMRTVICWMNTCGLYIRHKSSLGAKLLNN